MCTDHICLRTYPSMGRDSGGRSPFSFITNKAAVNVGYRRPLGPPLSVLWACARKGSAGPRGRPCLILWDLPPCLPPRLPRLTLHPSTRVLLYFDSGRPRGAAAPRWGPGLLAPLHLLTRRECVFSRQTSEGQALGSCEAGRPCG